MSEVKNSPSLDDVFDDKKVTDTNEGRDNQNKRGKRGKRKKVVLNLKCPLCESGIKTVNYKDVYQLKKFTSVRGKIIHPEKSGACRKHQRQIAKAIKRARYVSLLPYVHIE